MTKISNGLFVSSYGKTVAETATGACVSELRILRQEEEEMKISLTNTYCRAISLAEAVVRKLVELPTSTPGSEPAAITFEFLDLWPAEEDNTAAEILCVRGVVSPYWVTVELPADISSTSGKGRLYLEIDEESVPEIRAFTYTIEKQRSGLVVAITPEPKGYDHHTLNPT